MGEPVEHRTLLFKTTRWAIIQYSAMNTRKRLPLFFFATMSFIILIADNSLAQFRNGASSTQNTNSLFTFPTPETLDPRYRIRYFVGFSVGANAVNYKSSTFSIFNPDTTSPTQNGSGYAPLFTFSYHIALDEGIQTSIMLELSYDSKSAAFTRYTSEQLQTTINGIHYDYYYTNDLVVSLSYLMFGIGYKYNFLRTYTLYGPGVQLTANVGYNLSSTFTRSYNLIVPSASQTLERNSKIDGINNFRFSMRGQFSYDFPIDGTIIVTPLIGYDFPFTKVDNTARSWSASSIYGAIAIHFPIWGTEE